MHNKVYAPFDESQVFELIAYQLDGRFGPITCPRVHAFCEESGRQLTREEVSATLHELRWTIQRARMLPSKSGWACVYEDCDYTRDWAWEWVANGSWRAVERRVPLRRSG